MEIVSLYREIGKTLHHLGALRAVLIRSKASPGASYEMSLDIAVDGEIDLSAAASQCAMNWPQIEIKLIDLNDFSNIDLMTEVIEDGIQL